jgi:tRNA A58 N-methylase Trm61
MLWSTSVFASILQQNGDYEPHVVEAIQKRLKSGNTFIDIGANLGFISLIASSLVGPSGKVIAFEPVTETYNFCMKNIELNKLNNVQLLKNGLWSEQKTLTISVSDGLGYSHISDNGEGIECIPLIPSI